MIITGSTKLLGILGKGISYTASPTIHNFSAKKLNINSVYVPFDYSGDDLNGLLRSLWDIGVVGFNVTTPYKTRVAQAIGSTLASVNTVYRTEQGWAGVSTDADGLAAGISRLGLSFSAFRRIIILGNGGVVTAILRYVATQFEHAPEVVVLRRNSGKDHDMMRALPKTFKVNFTDFDPSEFHDLLVGAAGETIVLQATNAPHHGDDLKRFADGMVRFNGVFVDLVYGKTSALYATALARGIPCQDGLPMLIEQARLAQKHWWGTAASYEDILSHLHPR